MRHKVFTIFEKVKIYIIMAKEIKAPSGLASSISEVFLQNKYTIDFYQREYKWKSGTVKTLLDDIWDRFYPSYERIKNTTVSKVVKELPRMNLYYLNSYVTYKVGEEIRIVDGQQRLTTLNLICLALHHLCKDENFPLDKQHRTPEDSNYKSRIKKLKIEERVYNSDSYGGDNSYIMGIGKERKEAFDALYRKNKAYKPGTVSTNNIKNNYDTIVAYLDRELVDLKVLYAFMAYYLNRVFLMHININDVEDVPMIFEVMNDRGVPLKAHEILKGKLLGKISNERDRETYVDIWEKQARMLKDEFPDEDDHLDSFFIRYFRAKHTSSLEEYLSFTKDTYHKTIESIERKRKRENGKTLGLFQHEASHREEAVKRFVEHEMYYYIGVYKKIRKKEYDTQRSPYTLFSICNKMDDNLIELCFATLDTQIEKRRERIEDPEEEKKIKQVAKLFDSYHSLLNLHGRYNSRRLSNRMIELLKALRKHEISQTFKNALEIIQKDDNKFDYADFDSFSYRSSFLKYFFARVEGYLREKVVEPPNYEEFLRRIGKLQVSRKKDETNIDIEHIFPSDKDGEGKRKFFEIYKDKEFYKDLSKKEKESFFKKERNRMGGLAVLDSIRNSSVKDQLYAHKKKVYLGCEFLLTKSLNPDFYLKNPNARRGIKESLEFDGYDDFEGSDIEKRHKWLYNVALRIWNFDAEEEA